ncbi:alpha/beta fold hydrolase [Rhodococcus sp. HNM0569]|uniref:alpha/beta fold hydrolase n=1 Tax=Rhodococcus sp. HNM0569 TaxID=2716340 RepID=UPI00146DF60F|nr:alpha/beta fold hydrolase [Rhodococcus sp. HNM0569]NLU82076.1 alpha/beta hydrolase [Rhodococcus sp. HNM0569]
MDVLPYAGAATRNAWKLTLGGGIRREVRTPRTLVRAGHHRDLYTFGRPGARVDAARRPVLLVPPLAAPATCFDLRPGQSLAAHLVDSGAPTYLVDYGTMTRSDGDLGFESWVHDILPDAIDLVAGRHDGAPVDVIGWSLGGTLSLLTAAAHPSLPIGSLTALATPVDYSRIPTIAPLQLIGRVVTERPLTAATDLLGGLPAPIVQASYRFTALPREIRRPMFVARNILRPDALAHMQSIDRFMGDMPGYPARFFAQMCAQLILGNSLAEGVFTLDDKEVRLSDVEVPVLAIGGDSDVIAPVASAEAVRTVLTGAPSVRFETVGGSHLGVVAGAAARTTTWRHLDRFLTGQAAPVA